MAQLTVAHLEQADIQRPTDTAGAVQRIPATYDSGYYSAAAAVAVAQVGFDPYMATGRQRHHAAAAEVTELPATTPERRWQLNADTRRTRPVRQAQSDRRTRVWPDQRSAWFPPVSAARLADNIRGEWRLVCLTHNLLKLWRYACAPSTV